jgi:hypothetical protein
LEGVWADRHMLASVLEPLTALAALTCHPSATRALAEASTAWWQMSRLQQLQTLQLAVDKAEDMAAVATVLAALPGLRSLCSESSSINKCPSDPTGFDLVWRAVGQLATLTSLQIAHIDASWPARGRAPRCASCHASSACTSAAASFWSTTQPWLQQPWQAWCS